MFAVMMIPAGKLQEKYGGKLITSIGGILTGLGLILSSVFTSTAGMCISFGMFAGSGIGIGYAAVTPAAVKWFPANKKGVITGIVVSGFGLSTIYMAPLTHWMINQFGIYSSFRILGISIIVIVVSLSQLFCKTESIPGVIEDTRNEISWREMIKNKRICAALDHVCIRGIRRTYDYWPSLQNCFFAAREKHWFYPGGFNGNIKRKRQAKYPA